MMVLDANVAVKVHLEEADGHLLTKTGECASLSLMTRHFDISGLSTSECLLLAEQLWEKARANPDAIPLTPAQLDELNRRFDAYERGDMPPGESWEIVRARVFGR